MLCLLRLIDTSANCPAAQISTIFAMHPATILAALAFACIASAQTPSTEDHKASRVMFPTYTNGRVAFTTSLSQRTQSPSEEAMSGPEILVAATTSTSSDPSEAKCTSESHPGERASYVFWTATPSGPARTRSTLPTTLSTSVAPNGSPRRRKSSTLLGTLTS